MELILELMLVPSVVTAPTTTTATSARIRPYSAMPWPSSRYFRLATADRSCRHARSITAILMLSLVALRRPCAFIHHCYRQGPVYQQRPRNLHGTGLLDCYTSFSLRRFPARGGSGPAPRSA